MSKKTIFGILILLLIFGVYLFFYMASKEKPVVNLGEIYVRVFNIEPGAVIKSPLQITGEARGTWYVGSSFPIKIYDSKGNLLGSTTVLSKDGSVNEDFEPFETTLIFSTPTTTDGELIFRRDDPSGLPEKNAEFKIPVKF